MSFAHFYLNPGESEAIAVDGSAYTIGFDNDQVMLEADEPFTGEIRKNITLYRDGLVFHLDRDDERVSVRVFSRHGSFDRRSAEWRQLAFAYYALAHNDEGLFRELPKRLVQTDEGRACQIYLESRNREDLETAGRMITGTRQWYVYIGRS